MGTNRNRSQGWKYAKETGHNNERIVAESISEMEDFNKVLNDGEYVVEVTFDGGKNQNKVDSVIGHKTTPKPDYYVKTNLRVIKPSHKKSNEGQAYLVSTDNIVKTIRYYGFNVPNIVEEGLKLFTGEDKKRVEDILLTNPSVKEENEKLAKSQRNKRLNISAIGVYDKNMLDELINFFTNNMGILCKIILSTGSVENDRYHSDYIFYKNLIEGNEKGSIFLIDDICEKSLGLKVDIGKKYGGTSFIFPWGRLQMHKGILQFRHDRDLINRLFC